MRRFFDHWLGRAPAIVDFFDDWLMRAAAAILVLIVAVVIFNLLTDLPMDNPLFGVFIYAMVPILFIAGAAVFIIAILRS